MTFPSPHSSVNASYVTPNASKVGRNAHLFQPPKSPASTLTTPTYATGPDYFSSGPRKRSRPDSSHGANGSSQWAATPSWVQCPTPSDVSHGSAHGQNSSMANERYMLAGGRDTPGVMSASDMDARQLHFGPLARERNGVARIPSSPNEEVKTSWTGLAFTLVGKVFTFGTSVFKGFYAGGGKGYEIHSSGLRSDSREGCSTPIPGAWQGGDFLGDFEQDNPATTASRPPNKRRQTDRDSWVMVGKPDLGDTSPRRKLSSTSIPRSSLSTRPSASRASSRRSLVPIPRRQSGNVPHASGSPAQLLPPMHDASLRRASFAPMRSSSRPNSSSGLQAGTAYVSPEAERYIKRRAKQDKQADAAIGDMSRQLAQLIRQGQEALGTKFSVEGGDDMDMDEGYAEENWS